MVNLILENKKLKEEIKKLRKIIDVDEYSSNIELENEIERLRYIIKDYEEQDNLEIKNLQEYMVNLEAELSDLRSSYDENLSKMSQLQKHDNELAAKVVCLSEDFKILSKKYLKIPGWIRRIWK